MNFVIVPANQPMVNVRDHRLPERIRSRAFPDSAERADRELAAVAQRRHQGAAAPGITLEQFQREGSGDRHLILLDPTRGRFHEFWQARFTDAGWQAAQASTFDLDTNRLRPERWTSSDAAGLPILPAIVRYDEVARGTSTTHCVSRCSGRGGTTSIPPAISPATLTDPITAAHGRAAPAPPRLRYHRVPAACAGGAEALKRHGMFVADNGSNWLLSIAPDRRITGLESLSRVKGSDFEVIVPTGPDEGPRAERRSMN